MPTLILDDFIEKSLDRDDTDRCFKCGADVPMHIVICWSCGHVLDEKIRNLVKDK